jgi:PilZ domain
VERRKASRYGIRIAVLFSWEDTQSKQAEGFTRDISVSGAYVLCEKNLRPGQGNTVTIQLILPSFVDFEAQGMKLKSRGQVLRTDDFPEESGFAVRAEFGMNLNTGDKNDGQSGELP